MAQDPVTGGRRFLVVHAHPLADSLAAALRDAAIEGIAAAGHESDLVDLYADGFDPCLSVEERAAFARTDYAPPSDIAGYCERLVSADGLVLVFPQWWFGMPAILKGFIDRVFVPGLTFAVDPATRALEPRLSRLRRCSRSAACPPRAPWPELSSRSRLLHSSAQQGKGQVCEWSLLQLVQLPKPTLRHEHRDRSQQ